MYFLKNIFNIREKLKKDEEKPFLEHLEDLRTMFVKILVTLLVGFVISWVFVEDLIELIKYPLRDLPDDAKQLVTLGPAEPFIGAFKVAIFASLILTFPLNLLWLGEFVLPGLTKKEKKVIIPLLGAGFALFLGGVVFAYLGVLPRVFDFFHEFGQKYTGTTEQLRFGYVVSFVTQICLIFGLGFQLPVVVLALVKLDLLSHESMKRSRSYAIVAIFIISAVITPTPDALTLSLLAGPLILLYEICIWLALLLEKIQARREAREKEADRARLKELVEGGAVGGAVAAGDDEPHEEDEDGHEGEFDEPKDPDFSPGNEFTNAVDEIETQDSDAGDPGGPGDEAPAKKLGEQEETSENAEKAYNDTYGDDQWDDHSDHDHYDHGTAGYFDDEYHREEFKDQIVDDVQRKMREQLKAELRVELLEEIREEIRREVRKEMKKGFKK